jgi:hypothetical protein
MIAHSINTDLWFPLGTMRSIHVHCSISSYQTERMCIRFTCRWMPYVGQKSVECHALPVWSITFTSFPQRKRSVKSVGMSPWTVHYKYSVVLYCIVLYCIVWLLAVLSAITPTSWCAAPHKLPLLLHFEVVYRCLIALWINKFNQNKLKDEVVPMNAMKANGGMKV